MYMNLMNLFHLQPIMCIICVMWSMGRMLYNLLMDVMWMCLPKGKEAIKTTTMWLCNIQYRVFSPVRERADNLSLMKKTLFLHSFYEITK